MAPTGAAGPPGSLRAVRSSPALSTKSGLDRRGEHAFGKVRGLEERGEEQYVPRALWTSSLQNPLKNARVEYPKEVLEQEANATAQFSRSMTNYVRHQLERQVQEAKASKGKRQAAIEEELAATRASLSKTMQDMKTTKHAEEEKRQVFRDGLAEQAAHNAVKVQEHLMREAYAAAEIKLRTTQQLCAELEEAQRKKEAGHREFRETMERIEKERSQQLAERTVKNEETRRTLRLLKDGGEPNVYLQQVKDVMAKQEVVYARFSAAGGKEDANRLAREDQRQERDIVNNQLRTDMMYAQRELGRERQLERMRHDLGDQVEAKRRHKLTSKIEQDCDLAVVSGASRNFLEENVSRSQAKQAEEREIQAAQILQMRDKQLRMKENEPHYRPPPAAGTMQVSNSLMAVAKAGKGKSASSTDLMDKLHAARDLSKPCGKPEIKPWIDITHSHGPGGLVGVFAGEGPTRSVLMTTGGPERLLTKTVEAIENGRDLNKKWYDGVSAAALKEGRQAASKRSERGALDKALTHPP